MMRSGCAVGRAMLFAVPFIAFVLFASIGVGQASSGFAEGFAQSAAITCGYRDGPALRFVDYRTLDADLNTRGTRNFFVALRLHGRALACADALSNYGPRGLIRNGYLDW